MSVEELEESLNRNEKRPKRGEIFKTKVPRDLTELYTGDDLIRMANQILDRGGLDSSHEFINTHRRKRRKKSTDADTKTDD